MFRFSLTEVLMSFNPSFRLISSTSSLNKENTNNYVCRRNVVFFYAALRNVLDNANRAFDAEAAYKREKEGRTPPPWKLGNVPLPGKLRGMPPPEKISSTIRESRHFIAL